MNPDDTIHAPGRSITIQAASITAGNINTADKKLDNDGNPPSPNFFDELYVDYGIINLEATSGNISTGRLSATREIKLTAKQQENQNITATGIEVIAKFDRYQDFDFDGNGDIVLKNTINENSIDVMASGLFRITDTVTRTLLGTRISTFLSGRAHLYTRDN